MIFWHNGHAEPARRANESQSAQHVPQQDGFQGTPERLRAIRPSSRRISELRIHNTNSGTPTTRAHARTSDSVGRMDPTIGHGAVRSHRQTCASPKLRAVAFALGCSESVAERRMYGAEAVNIQAAIIIAVLLRRGEVEDAASFESPISAAMLGPVPDAMGDAQRAADESDALEDCSQVAWIHDKSDEALALYIRKLASDLYHGTRLLAALKAEQAKRADK